MANQISHSMKNSTSRAILTEIANMVGMEKASEIIESFYECHLLQLDQSGDQTYMKTNENHLKYIIATKLKELLFVAQKEFNLLA